MDEDAKWDQQDAMIKELEQPMLEKHWEFASIEAVLRGRRHHLEDILKLRERELDSLCTNLCVTTDLAKTAKRKTKRL